MSATYTPREGSVAWKVIQFLQANPDEQLDADLISAKCDCDRRNVHTLLGPAVQAELLVRKADGEDGELVYTVGKGRKSAEGRAHQQLSQQSAAPAKARSAPFWIDATTVKIEKDTRALGLAKGTVHRLRHGYWPADPRKILQAWGRHKASRSVVGSSWFMRRVRPGGLVRHAGVDFTAPRLAARTGAFLAVTRTAEGSLLAQTLELPSERLPLLPVAEAGGAA